jgi:hypothetical protein
MFLRRSEDHSVGQFERTLIEPKIGSASGDFW